MVKVGFASDDFWKFFANKWKANKKKLPVTSAVYHKVIKEYNQEVVKQLLDGKVFKAPYRLGYFAVVRRPIKISKLDADGKRRLKIDYHATKKEGKAVYFLNDHTENHYCQLYWFKPSFKSHDYRIHCCRSFSRAIASRIKEDPNHYKNYRMFVTEEKQ